MNNNAWKVTSIQQDDVLDYGDEDMLEAAAAKAEAVIDRLDDPQEVPADETVPKLINAGTTLVEIIERDIKDPVIRDLILHKFNEEKNTTKEPKKLANSEVLKTTSERIHERIPSAMVIDHWGPNEPEVPQTTPKAIIDPMNRILEGSSLKVAKPYGFKLNQVETYNGEDPELAMEYVSKMNLFLKLIHETEDSARIGHFGMRLTGVAWDWYQTFLARDDFSQMGFKDLQEEFICLFGTQLQLHTARQVWQECKQGKKSPEKYVIAYRNALTRYSLLAGPTQRPTNWDACTRFIGGLSPSYRELVRKKLTFTGATRLQDVIQILLLEAASATAFNEIEPEPKTRITMQEYKNRPKTPEMQRKFTKGKRKVPYVPVTCNHCGVHGHTKSRCPLVNELTDVNKTRDLDRTLECTHCKKLGHLEEQCWIKHPNLRPKKKEKQVKFKGLNPKMAMIKSKTPRLPGITLKAKINKSGYSLVHIDNGCDISQLTKKFCIKHGIKFLPTNSKVEFGNFDTQDVYLSEPIELQIDDHIETRQFHVVETCIFDAILGLDWLHEHNPVIDWKTPTVTFQSEHCKRNCFQGNHMEQISILNERLSDLPLFKNQRVTSIMTIPTLHKSNVNHYLINCEERGEMQNLHVKVNENLRKKARKMHTKQHFRKDKGHNKSKSKYYMLSISTVDNNSKLHIVDPNSLFDKEEFFSSENHIMKEDELDNRPLTQEELNELPKEYHDYADVFSKSDSEKLPQHRPYDIGIDLVEGSKPKWGPLYHMSNEEMAILKDYIDDNLKKGYIRTSSSPMGAPVLFVKKKDGSLRLCVDYRALNDMTIKDGYPIPLIDELIDRLKRAKIFTALDLRGAYNLVRVKEGDEWKTAFRTRYGHYEYLVMPFGLSNAPAVFQRLMNDVFREYLDKFVIIYLDDILIYSETMEEHVDHVRKVMQLLRDNNLYCKLSKCEFHKSEVEFLGFVVSSKGVTMNSKKVQTILEWEAPKTVKGIRSFLGFANYYRRFIKDFACIVRPLTALTRKNVQFEWDEKCQAAFDKLKHLFISAPILQYADFTKEFIVETDSSDFAVGMVLSQYHNELLHPVAYYSRKLTETESRWKIHDKELYAIILAFKQWRQYLLHSQHPVIIWSDHRNLQYFMQKQFLNGRQLNWMMFLQDFSFQIAHKPGRLMSKPDALSRREEYQYTDIEHKKRSYHQLIHVDSIIPTKVTVMQHVTYEVPVSIEQLKLLIQSDTIQSELWGALILKGGVDGDYVIKNSFIYFQDKIYVAGNECRLLVLKYLHDSPVAGHPGIQRTIELVKRTFWWPKLHEFVKDYVLSCVICQSTKKSRHKPYGLLKPLPIPTRPWMDIAMDFAFVPTSNGNDLILVVVCRLTKHAHFIALQSTITAQEFSNLFFERVISIHGKPCTIVTDRGSIFTSKFWKEWTQALNITQLLSTAYHQETDGQSERVVQILKQYLRAYLTFKQDNWCDYLALAEFAYNNAYHSSIGMSPFKALFGYDFSLFDDLNTEDIVPSVGDKLHDLHKLHQQLQDAIKIAQSKYKEYADRKRKIAPLFKVNDLVWLSTSHLKSQRPSKSLDYTRIGPFKIKERVNDLAFRLELPAHMKIHDVFHVNLLEPYNHSTIVGRTNEPIPPIEYEDGLGNVEYEVNEILDVKIIRNKIHYFVDWKGYGVADRTWEPIENVSNAKDKLNEFYNKYPNAIKEIRETSRKRIGDGLSKQTKRRNK